MFLADEVRLVIVRRWQEFTGRDATLEGAGRTFNQIADYRGGRDE